MKNRKIDLIWEDLYRECPEKFDEALKNGVSYLDFDVVKRVSLNRGQDVRLSWSKDKENQNAKVLNDLGLSSLVVSKNKKVALLNASIYYQYPAPQNHIIIKRDRKDKRNFSLEKTAYHTENDLFIRFENICKRHRIKEFPFRDRIHEGKTSLEKYDIELLCNKGTVFTVNGDNVAVEIDNIFDGAGGKCWYGVEKKCSSSIEAFKKEKYNLIQLYTCYEWLKENGLQKDRNYKYAMCVSFKNEPNKYIIYEIEFNNGILNDIKVTNSTLFEIVDSKARP